MKPSIPPVDDSPTPSAGSLAWLSRPVVALTAAILALAGWAYWPTLLRIWEAWGSNPDYTHGFLVAPLAIWLAWVRRESAPAAAWGMHWGGAVLLAVAALLRFAAGRFYLPELDAWSIPLWVGGAVWMLAGWATFRWSLPAVAFLWFATPLPGSFEIALSTPLQKLAASLSGWTLRVLGQPAIVEGTTILIDDQALDVERACSGLRMFFGIFAMAYACVILTYPSRWKALLILASTAPIAVAANVARIAATGLLLTHVSGEAAHQFSHDFAGLAMIPVAVALFAGLHLLLAKIARRCSTEFGTAVVWLGRWSVGWGVLVIAAILWGNHQQQHALTTLRDAAERYAAEDKPAEAIQYLSRYVRACPDDAAASCRLSELLLDFAEGGGDHRRAAEMAKIAWRQSPDRVDLAIRAAELSLRVGDDKTCVELAQQLMAAKLEPTDKAKIIKHQADAMLNDVRQGEVRADYGWDDVATSLQKSLALPDYEVRHAAAMADALRLHLSESETSVRIEQADAIMDQLVNDRPNASAAWLARSQYRRRFSASEPDEAAAIAAADDDLAKALTLAEKSTDSSAAEVYLYAAARRRDQGDALAAIALLPQAIALAPEDAQAYVMLAELQRQAKADGRKDAIATLRRAMDAMPHQSYSVVLPLAALHAEAGDFDAADELIAPLEKTVERIVGPDRGVVTLGLGLVRAQIELSRGGPQAGMERLRRLLELPEVRGAAQSQSQMLAQAWYMLGRLHLALNAPDQASAAFEQAGQISSPNCALRLEMAQAALQAGNIEEAQNLYRRIAQESPQTADAWLALARIELGRQQQAAVTDQRWKTFDELIRRAVDAGGPTISARLLVAERNAAAGKIDQARASLQKFVDAHPDEAPAWRALATLADLAGDSPAALAAADRYLALAPAGVDGALLKSALLAKADRGDEALTLLTSLRADASDPDQFAAASRALAQFHLQSGSMEQAVVALEEARKNSPRNVAILETLASLAWQNQDWALLEQREQQLREAEGNGGTLWRAFQAQRLLGTIDSTTDPRFKQLATLVDSLVRDRPRWANSYYLQGEVALRANQTDAATASFERAWQCGSRNILLADRLIDLLTQRGRHEDAQSYVRQVRDLWKVSTQLFDRALPYYAAGADRVEAVRVAERWVEQQPQDGLARLRLARVLHLTASGSTEDERPPLLDRAEAEYRQAISLAPTDVRPWVAAVAFYAQTRGSRADALQVMGELSQQVGIGELERTFVLAQLHEALGMPTEAQDAYRQAVALAKRTENSDLSANVLASAARFYMPRVPSLAEDYAREALRHDGSLPLPRLLLLQLLGDRNDEPSLQEAFALLESLGGGADSTNGQARRLRAVLLARRGQPQDLDEGIAILEEMIERTADDKLLLAQLYERADRLGPAYELFDELARQTPARPQDLVQFLRFWQAHFLAKPASDDAAEETPQFAQFAGRAREVYGQLSGSPELLATQLRWRLREAQARSEGEELTASDFAAAIEPFLAAPELTEVAERQDQRRPLMLAILRTLLEEQAIAPAFDLATSPPEWIDGGDAAMALCYTLISLPGDAELQATAAPTLAALSEELADNASVLQAIGDYYYISGQYPLALGAYRRVLKIDPARHMALNNLALAMIEQDELRGEAHAAIAQALTLQPNDPSLRDTQAIVALVGQQPAEARQILEQLLAADAANPVFHLHLAMTQDALGESELASDSFQQSVALGVSRSLLSQRDRAFVAKMLDEQSAAPTPRPQAVRVKQPPAPPVESPPKSQAQLSTLGKPSA